MSTTSQAIGSTRACGDVRAPLPRAGDVRLRRAAFVRAYSCRRHRFAAPISVDGVHEPRAWSFTRTVWWSARDRRTAARQRGTGACAAGRVPPKPRGGAGGLVSPKPRGGAGGLVSPKPRGGAGGLVSSKP